MSERLGFADGPLMQLRMDYYMDNPGLGDLHLEIMQMKDRLECNERTVRALNLEIMRGKKTLNCLEVAYKELESKLAPND